MTIYWNATSYFQSPNAPNNLDEVFTWEIIGLILEVFIQFLLKSVSIVCLDLRIICRPGHSVSIHWNMIHVLLWFYNNFFLNGRIFIFFSKYFVEIECLNFWRNTWLGTPFIALHISFASEGWSVVSSQNSAFWQKNCLALNKVHLLAYISFLKMCFLNDYI